MVDLIYAGAFQRMVALIIDFIVVSFLGFILQLIVVVPKIQYLLGQVVLLTYFVTLESVNQATIGKMALGIYIAKTDGGKMKFNQVLLRYVVWALPIVPLVVYEMVSNYPDILAQMQTFHDPKAMADYMQQPEVMKVLIQLLIITTILGACNFAFYFLPMCFTKQKTGLHDIVAKARVFKK